jgi:hypothetical protein
MSKQGGPSRLERFSAAWPRNMVFQQEANEVKYQVRLTEKAEWDID